MTSESAKSHSDWKDCLEYLCNENCEIILTVLNLDFCGSSEIIEKSGNAVAHRLLEDSRAVIDRILDSYTSDIAKGHWHGDSIVVIFKETAKAISAAQRIMRNLRWGNIKLGLRIAIDKNIMIFKKEIGRSTSKALGYTKRLREMFEEKNILVITKDIYNFLEAKVKNQFKDLGYIEIEKPKRAINAYILKFEPRKLVNLVVNSEGEIKSKFVGDESTKRELEEIEMGQNVLNLAKELCKREKKVILIEQSDQPIISDLALRGRDDIGEIIKEKIYTSSNGYDVYWEEEIQFPRPIWIETDYDWLLVIKHKPEE